MLDRTSDRRRFLRGFEVMSVGSEILEVITPGGAVWTNASEHQKEVAVEDFDSKRSAEPLRLAIAQMQMSADVRANGRLFRLLMDEAAEAGARLIQFPEGALTGYAKEQIRDWTQVDWTSVDEEHRLIADRAAELGIWVVFGSTHRLSEGNRPHNSLYVIADDGTLVTRYDKRFCSHTEVSQYYTPGVAPRTFTVDGFTFGMAICIEINFPEVFAEYERLGVDCVLLSAYPVDSIIEVKARAHAAINNYWVSMATPAQTSDLLDSELIGPDGSVLGSAGVSARNPADQNRLIIGDLDRSDPAFAMALTKSRPWRESARLGEIYRERLVDDPRSEVLTQF